MTRPFVQVWNSLLQWGPLDEAHQADLMRAQREWQNDDVIWLMPGASQSVRWHMKAGPLQIQNCLIPAETFDRIDVFHIDQEGRRFPPLPLPQAWQGRLREGLYRLWLDADVRPMSVDGFKLPVPEVSGSDIVMKQRSVQFEAETFLPFVAADEASREVTSAWPPPNRGLPPPVSPEGESRRFYGNDARPAGLQFRIGWPEPFNVFFPTGTGADVLYHRDEMRRLIQHQDLEQARTVAQSWSERLVRDAEASIDRAFVAPALLDQDRGLLINLAERFGIEAESIDQLANSEELRRAVTRGMPVLRVQGWIGYFWWELANDLKAARTVRLCKRCGKVMRGGHADRELCSRSENPECYRERNSENQRRRRARSTKPAYLTADEI